MTKCLLFFNRTEKGDIIIIVLINIHKSGQKFSNHFFFLLETMVILTMQYHFRLLTRFTYWDSLPTASGSKECTWEKRLFVLMTKTLPMATISQDILQWEQVGKTINCCIVIIGVKDLKKKNPNNTLSSSSLLPDFALSLLR